ncbi:CPBP family intramembrane glutamic endopeptidase [Kocuria aegyptia]
MTSHPPRRPAPWQSPGPAANLPPGVGRPAPPAGRAGAPAPYPGPPRGGALLAGGPPTTAPLTHAEFYRTPRNRWWKGLLSILAIGAALAVFSIALSLGATLVDLLLGNSTAEELAGGRIALTPALLLATNLSLIAAAAVGAVLHRYLHRQPIGTLHSVAGRFRWNWLGRASVVVVPLFVAYAAVIALLETSGPTVLDATTWAFLAIVLLTTPLQAASEEYLFRGVIQRAAGSWVSGAVPSFVLGTLVSAVLFSLAHFATDGWLIAYYLVFGIAMSLLTQFTGGLEAASLVHAANNVLLFLVSTFSGQMNEAVDRSAGAGGPFMLGPMVVIAVITAVLIAIGRWQGLQHRAVPPVGA